MQVFANRVESFDTALQPGDFFWAERDARMHFRCPCGCGTLAGVVLQPKYSEGWTWNGNEDQPTVRPSIDINRGHWHGYLTDGVFKSCD